MSGIRLLWRLPLVLLAAGLTLATATVPASADAGCTLRAVCLYSDTNFGGQLVQDTGPHSAPCKVAPFPVRSVIHQFTFGVSPVYHLQLFSDTNCQTPSGWVDAGSRSADTAPALSYKTYYCPWAC